MIQKCCIYSKEEIQFTGMQKCGDECNEGFILYPHPLLKLDRLALTNFNLMSAR